MSGCVLELEQQNTSKLDVRCIVKVESNIEGGTTIARICDPILLVFSVRNLTFGDRLSILHLKECAANGCANKVTLELGDLGCDGINHTCAFSSDFVIASTHGRGLLL